MAIMPGRTGAYTMAWKITRDLLEGKDVHISNMHDNIPMPFKFRLLDDDGIVYFEGYSNDNESLMAFDPLDWALADSGCTSIEYLNNGTWETL
jgi:hypothetical protein